jgi:hypothetical protein
MIKEYEKSIIDYENPKKGQYRDVASKGGYFYRQFEDGTIRVMEKSPKLAGTVLYEDDKNSTNRKRWKAITNEIGTWGQYVAERREGRLQAAGSILSTVGEVIGKTKKGKKRRKSAAAPISTPSLPMDTEETPSEMPSWLVPAAVVAGIVVVVVVSNKSPEGGRKRKTDGE